MISFRRASKLEREVYDAWLETNALTRSEVVAAVRVLPPSQDFVWTGWMKMTALPPPTNCKRVWVAQRKRGRRPTSGVTKEQVAIRFDRDVLRCVSRPQAPGWQTQI